MRNLRKCNGFGFVVAVMNKLISRLSVRSIVVLLFVVGALILAVIDSSFRPTYGHLADVAIGGYLGQLMPQPIQGVIERDPH